MWMKNFMSLVFPYTCLLCKSKSDRHQDLCSACYRDLPFATHCCEQCAIPMSRHEKQCGQCLKHPPFFDKAYTLFIYQNPVTALLLALKFNQAIVNARILGELLAETARIHWYQDKPYPDALIPIPLHPTRLKERGFNQALEIARPVAKMLQLPLLAEAGARIKATAPQASLKASMRLQNVNRAFSIKNDFLNQHVAVIDDVMTTGSTMNAFCSELKAKGARRIDVWCCARPCL